MNSELTIARIKEVSNTQTSKCMKCGKCSARCPSFDSMDIKPHQFVSYVEKGELEPLLASKSIWSCLSCMACVERCPRGVAPANLIEAVRNTVEGLQNGDAVKAEDIPALVDETIPQQLLVAIFRKYKK